MEPGDIGIRVKVGGRSEDPEQIEVFGKLWSGPYAKQIHAWLDTCQRNKPGKSAAEIMVEGIVLGLANMTSNFERIEKQERLNAARLEELAKQDEEIQALGDRADVVRVVRIREEEDHDK